MLLESGRFVCLTPPSKGLCQRFNHIDTQVGHENDTHMMENNVERDFQLLPKMRGGIFLRDTENLPTYVKCAPI